MRGPATRRLARCSAWRYVRWLGCRGKLPVPAKLMKTNMFRMFHVKHGRCLARTRTYKQCVNTKRHCVALTHSLAFYFGGLFPHIYFDPHTSPSSPYLIPVQSTHLTLPQGNQLHWIACSLTHACWQASVDTVQQGEDPVHGGGVSLNNILRKCEIE